MGASRAFVKEANNSLDKRAGDHDKFSLRVVGSPENDDGVVKRHLVEQLRETFETAALGSKFIGRGSSLFFNPLPQLFEFCIS